MDGPTFTKHDDIFSLCDRQGRDRSRHPVEGGAASGPGTARRPDVPGRGTLRRPDWTLLLRSSLELHLAALLHGDPTRESYFALAARLTTQNPLAANAAAEIPLRERLGLPDLEPLIGYCLAPGATAERLAARRFASQLLAGALHLRHMPAGQKAAAVPALAAAARRLAEAAERDLDIEFAGTATVIVNRIRTLPGWQPD